MILCSITGLAIYAFMENAHIGLIKCSMVLLCKAMCGRLHNRKILLLIGIVQKAKKYK